MLHSQQTGNTPSARHQVLVIGESPAVGVGVHTEGQSLTAQIAYALSEQSGETWNWQVVGENGATLSRLIELLDVGIDTKPDCTVIVTGVNDCTGLTSRKRWRDQLSCLINRLQKTSNAPIVFTPVPPVHSFTALPQPLRWVIGQRAKQLNQDIRSTTQSLAGVHCADVLPSLTAEQLASDRFHPSPSACAEWGRRTATVIQSLLS
ncbi:MAG: SGNH/GDSL hydrolase family protein [Salinisphaeraceae bacterium]|nr:SGNH/GDSL hydrolase family protein [Salinisphaeraceae bacterium]